jgi:threonine aldolase
MNFCSDNSTGAADEILAAIVAANDGATMPYGNDDQTRGAEATIADVFECEADVFLLASGTAANALCLSVMAPPVGAVYCHARSHIHNDECGAPEFYTGGAKLVPLEGDHGRIRAPDLKTLLETVNPDVHYVRPAAVSLTQSTEAGTVYSIDEIAGIADLAHGHGLKLHMDGARFANAVAALGCSPADLTWRAGVDALSFGATKNGALAAEAVVLFDRSLAATFASRRMRGGHLLSKSRFLAAQFDAYLCDGRWLGYAAHANAMAARLAASIEGIAGARILHPVQANEIFVSLPETILKGLEGDGFGFYRWGGEASTTIRLVCAFNTTESDVDAFVESARGHAGR